MLQLAPWDVTVHSLEGSSEPPTVFVQEAAACAAHQAIEAEVTCASGRRSEPSRSTLLLKRIEDLALGMLILLLVACPMLLVALAIRLTSPGPIFYRQTRFGRNGLPFKIWKFRTMSVCDEDHQVAQSFSDDPRVTPLGRFLRRTCLDELPNFFNVLLGDMSVVGPRPYPIAMDAALAQSIPGYTDRRRIKPGVTGLAQASGYQGGVESLEELRMRLELDLNYLRSSSLWLDLKIVAKTALILLRPQDDDRSAANKQNSASYTAEA